MLKEADRLIAEFLGETDHLKKWCSDAGAGEPLQLCIEDPGETQRPDSCRHLAKGGCWNDCKSKATVDLPAYSTLDSAAWEAIKALGDMPGILVRVDFDTKAARVVITIPTDGMQRPIPMQFTSVVMVGGNLLAKALGDAMVEKYTAPYVTGFGPANTVLRIKPALLRAMKGGNDEAQAQI